MSSACRRTWEVEAVRDGRVGASESASLERHLVTCEPCRREQTALARLAEALRADDAAVDELALRRLRQSTLEGADAELCAPEPNMRAHRPWLAFAIAAVALLSLSVGVYSMSALHRLERAILEQAGDERNGRAELSDPKETVTHIVPVDAASSPRHQLAPAPAAELPSVPRKLHLRRSALKNANAPDQSKPEPVLSAVTSTSEPKGADDAVSTAEAVDGEDEDLTYLRIVVLVREARVDEARLEARRYLTKFPRGFRRVEVERLAR